MERISRIYLKVVFTNFRCIKELKLRNHFQRWKNFQKMEFRYLLSLSKSTLTRMPSKVPPDYFLYPEFLAFAGFPVVWILLPVAAFNPDLLVDHLPTDIFKNILIAQVNSLFSHNDTEVV